jgi:hypothetical protein
MIQLFVWAIPFGGDSGLGSDYTYNWLGSSLTTPIIPISTAGQYALKITDSLGNVFSNDTISVNIDSFSIKDSLGSDRSVCKYETITAQHDGIAISSWHWNNGSIQSSIPVTTVGDYHVTVTNTRGCTSSDTVHFTLAGIAPNPLFTSDTVCSGNKHFV